MRIVDVVEKERKRKRASDGGQRGSYTLSWGSSGDAESFALSTRISTDLTVGGDKGSAES